MGVGCWCACAAEEDSEYTPSLRYGRRHCLSGISSWAVGGVGQSYHCSPAHTPLILHMHTLVYILPCRYAEIHTKVNISSWTPGSIIMMEKETISGDVVSISGSVRCVAPPSEGTRLCSPNYARKTVSDAVLLVIVPPSLWTPPPPTRPPPCPCFINVVEEVRQRVGEAGSCRSSPFSCWKLMCINLSVICRNSSFSANSGCTGEEQVLRGQGGAGWGKAALT